MILRNLFLTQIVFIQFVMCRFNEKNAQVEMEVEERYIYPASTTHHLRYIINTTTQRARHRLCSCRKYRCSCCLNFSFIRRWKALGCFNIQSLPGNLNIILSFSFNNRHLAVFPIAGSRPMPFCKQLHAMSAVACLVIYNVRTNTPHDVMVCLYMELRVGDQPVATVHLDCIRKIDKHLQFIPIASHHRKGTLFDLHVLPNDTTLTILRQEFHWTRESSDTKSGSDESLESEDDSDGDSDEEVEIKLEPRNGLFYWLKRLFFF